MQLRSITLSGFKTFARRTEIRFDSGVTAIVGPNGSGKSNTVDAFKWVLGESQAKDLRGRRMEEVIYAGGERRPRASAAEVTIVIDNSDRRIPVDYLEVAIKRQVDRGGASEYFLNETRIRRRDLIQMLASTGLTTDSYSIVDQRDIESIISSTPEQRRQLIEEAARVRGVKAKRGEAIDRLRELATNLVRLEDLKADVEPRLEQVRAQAAAATEADLAQRRLEVLRGSIVYEQWRQARDLQRRQQTQIAALERRLAEAASAIEASEGLHSRARAALEAAQNQRLQRQRLIGDRELAVAGAEHALALAEERAQSQAALATQAAGERAELEARAAALALRRTETEDLLSAATAAIDAIRPPLSPPPAADAELPRRAQAEAEKARRRLIDAVAARGALETRLRFLRDSVASLEARVAPAEAGLRAAGEGLKEAQEAAQLATEAATRLAAAEAELAALEALRPAPPEGLQRLGDVLAPRSGAEPFLSAVLGPLFSAWAAPDRETAERTVAQAVEQVTVFFPEPGAATEPDSVLDQVRCDPGFEALGQRLLGSLVPGREVGLDGVLRVPGMIRGGNDPSVQLAVRRRTVMAELEAAKKLAGLQSSSQERLAEAQMRLQTLRSAAAERGRLDEERRQLELGAAEQTGLEASAPALQEAAERAEAAALELRQALTEGEQRMAQYRAEVGRASQEKARAEDRRRDLTRQRQAIDQELLALGSALADRDQKANLARVKMAELAAMGPAQLAALQQARSELARAEERSPEGEVELAAAAKELTVAEEARVGARISASRLEGSLQLLRREHEGVVQEMNALRAQMPEGMTPDEVPGGKAREREMRQLERRLDEIGPTNPLAESEARELEERYQTLATQLQDITLARADLEQLIGRLRAEEDERYGAVFGAVAAGFLELFQELSGGGKASLRHTAGSDGPQSGVEILVQPPRKKAQNLTLLSSGERSLTALALVLALEAVNPAPFTILDEVDAALDDANVGRFGLLLQRLGSERQLLVITHNHATMATASNLFGVHLDESGCSHLVSVRLEDVSGRDKGRSAQSA